MNPSPEFLPRPEAAAAFNPATAMDMRIGQLNNAVLGTAINLLPAAVGIGVLVYGFRQVYKHTLGNILS
ncbi:hypothetical protein A3G69_02750 [Candidatus Peribacteria bacterium RIFCSPLOWO2_12_FULL_53_10]|nr:MAG: hypothetical protein A3G69_02750 [Candidatus Peribacteria bacterium RIFCSPLOWO2_12_FULL_53_10]